jgi:hypothetical protein
MPAANPQRVWFPEMLAKLQGDWRETMSLNPTAAKAVANRVLLLRIENSNNVSRDVG